MLNQKGVLFDHLSRRIVPRIRIDDEERGWSYWNGNERYQELPGDRQDIINESYRAAIKDVLTDEAKQHQKFSKLVKQAGRVLYKMQTVFPFDFFPTTVTIDPEKITLQIRNFFSSGEIRSIHVKNVSHIFVDTGPFFGKLILVDQSILDNEVGKVEIGFLKKEEAKKARRIIQGLIVTDKENIDVTKIQDDDMVRKLEEIGRMHS